MRVFVVSELYYPEETSTGFIMTRIAEGLAQTFEVHAICVQPSYSLHGVRAPRHEKRNNVTIRRCWATAFDRNKLGLRLLNLLTITFSTFVQMVWRFRRANLVLVVTNPPLLPFSAALACWLKGARCILIVHDKYPDVLAVTGILRPSSLAYRLAEWLNRWLYARMVRIAVLGRDMQATLERHIRRERRSRVVIAPNWADVDEVRPDSPETNSLLRELGLNDKFVVQCAGNMGRPNDLETIVDAAAQLHDDQDIHFLFVGSGAKRGWLEAQVRERSLTNVTILPPRPRSNQQVFLNACHVAVISLRRGMAGVGVPSRTYNIMAAGKPILVIADDEAEPALIAREERIGWVVPPGAPDALIRAIRDARSDPLRLLDMGRRGRRAAETKYSYGRVIETYRNLIDDASHESAT